MRKIRHYGLSAHTVKVYSCKLIEMYHWLVWRSGLGPIWSGQKTNDANLLTSEWYFAIAIPRE